MGNLQPNQNENMIRYFVRCDTQDTQIIFQPLKNV